MGKATRWLRGLLGLRKDNENVHKNPIFSEKKEKKNWAFTKSGDESAPLHQIPANDFDWLRYLITDSEMEQSKHAIAVAAATAAAADAAVAAAQAAVAVVRLTSQGRGGFFADGTGRAAAVRIQAVFRGYLARKALRALKGLVKLQALVRGYLVRKRAAATLHSIQALFRAQASVRSQRARRSMSTDYRSHPQIKARRKSSERLDDMRGEFHSKRLSSSHDPSFDESPKTVEIDTCGPRLRSRRMSTCVSEYYGDPHFQLMSSPIIPCPMTNRTPIHSCHHNRDFDWGFVHDYKFATAQNTPRFGCSGSGRAYAVTTPAAKSACWESGVLEPHSSTCPSYMANTQCFRAKLRSHSAPKQRPKKEVSLTEMMASRASFSGVRMKCSSSRSCSDQAEEGF